MATLKTVYGNISESYAEVMKSECKEQVKQFIITFSKTVAIPLIGILQSCFLNC